MTNDLRVTYFSILSFPFETHRLLLLSEEEWKTLTEFYQCDHEICVQRDPGDEKVITTRPRKYYLIGHLHVSLSLSLPAGDMQSEIHKGIPRPDSPSEFLTKETKGGKPQFLFFLRLFVAIFLSLGSAILFTYIFIFRADNSPLSVLLLQI